MQTVPPLTELSLLVCTASKRQSLTLLRQIVSALSQYSPDEGKWAIDSARIYLNQRHGDWLTAALKQLEKSFENSWAVPYTALLWEPPSDRVPLSQVVKCRLTAWDNWQISERIEAEGISRGEFARRALVEFMERGEFQEVKPPDMGSLLTEILNCRVSLATDRRLQQVCSEGRLRSDVLRVAVLTALQGGG